MVRAKNETSEDSVFCTTLLFVLVTWFITIGACQEPLTFCVSLTTQGPISFINTIGIRARDGLLLYQNVTGQKVIIAEDYGNMTSCLQNYNNFSSWCTFLLGPIGSRPNLILKDDLTRPFFAINAATKDFYGNHDPRNIKYLSVNPSAPYFGLPVLTSLRLKQIKQLVLMQAQGDPFVNEICQGVIDNAKKRYGLEVLETIKIPVAMSLMINYSQPLEDALNYLVEKYPEQGRQDRLAVYICDYTGGLYYLVKGMKKRNYNVDAIVAGYMSQSEIFKYLANDPDSNVLHLVIGNENIHPNVNYEGNDTYPLVTYANFVSAFQAYHDTMDVPDAVSAFSYVAPAIIQHAVRLYNTTDELVIYNTIRSYTTKTFFGDFKWDIAEQHRQSPIVQINQVSDASSNIVGPFELSDQEPILPIPKWEERIPNQVRWDYFYTIEIVCYIIGAVFMALISIAIIIMIKNREDRIMKAGQWFLIITMCLGSLLGILTIYLWRIDDYNGALCISRFVTLVLAFYLMFGSLTVKNLRFFIIATNQSLKVFAISNLKALLMLLAILIIPVVLLVIRSFLSNMQLVRMVVDQYRPSYDYFICVSDQMITPVDYINLTYGLLLLAFALVISLKTYKQSVAEYDDGKPTVICILFVLILSLVILAITIILGSDHSNVQFVNGLILCLILVAASIPVAIMFGNRLVHYNNSGIKINLTTFKATPTHSSPMTSSNGKTSSNKNTSNGATSGSTTPRKVSSRLA